MFRKLLCISPPSPDSGDGSRMSYGAQSLSSSTGGGSAVTAHPSLERQGAVSADNGGEAYDIYAPRQRVNHYHPRPVATIEEAERQRQQQEEEEEEAAKASKKKNTAPELEIDSAYSLHVALGRILVVASLAAGEQPSVTLVKGHLQLIEEYNSLANRKGNRASADYKGKRAQRGSSSDSTTSLPEADQLPT
eukprot:scpid35465/ scgid32316/ 